VTIDERGGDESESGSCARRIFLYFRVRFERRRSSTVLPPTGELRSFRRAGRLVVVQLVAELAAAAVTDERVLTDLMTKSRVESTLVVVWLHSTHSSVAF